MFTDKYVWLSLIIAAHVLIFAGCVNQSSNEVVVYTSVDQVFSEPILKDFEKDTGVKVKAVFDTEETKSTGVLNRLIAEKDNSQCDVFWSGDPIRAIVLKHKGITMPYDSPAAKDISDNFKDKERHWTGFSARARVLIYNKNLLPQADVPRHLFDLTQAKYRGRFAIANPLFGTTSFHFAALFSVLGDVKASQFLSELKQNKVIICTSNGDVKKRVARGEIWCGLTDTDDANEALKEGAPVGIVFLDREGLGTLINPNTVSLINNSPHNSNGKKLMDYLLSRETESKLARSCVQMPLHKGVAPPANLPPLDSINPMKIDYNKTARKLEEIQVRLKEWSEKK